MMQKPLFLLGQCTKIILPFGMLVIFPDLGSHEIFPPYRFSSQVQRF